jgi:PA domain
MKGKLLIHKKAHAALLVAMACGGLQAADVFYDFTTSPPGGDPTGGLTHCAPCTSGFTVIGTHADAGRVWCSGIGFATNGNPVTEGYVSIADGGQNSQSTVIVFPDVDSGNAISAFHLTADLRVGNADGCGGRPADGFSINYCREGDPILVNATNGIAFGAAGGDDCPTTINPAGSGDFESGTKTGVAICFDAWFGNLLPDTGTGGGCGPDTEGIEIRANDHTLLQLCMQGDRNGSCNFTNPPVDPCNDTACSDPNTEQTGGEANDGGDFSTLCWQRLDVLVTNGPAAGTKLVTVSWKGNTLINNYLITNFPNYRGRLVLMGRTGGCNQNDHIANVHLVTTVAQVATYDSVEFGPAPNQFNFTVDDNGSSVVTNISQVLLDGVDVTSSVVTSKTGSTTTGTYTQTQNLTPGSSHNVTVTFKDSQGATLGGTSLKLLVPDYLALTTAMAVPGASIDQTKPGFLVKPHQTLTGEPNRNYWADEQLEGLHGTNEIDFATGVSNVTATGESSYDSSLDGPALVDFSNGQSAGQFPFNLDFSQFGIPAPTNNVPCGCTDNSALAISTYLYFPMPGWYYLGVNSDDGFRVSFAKNSHDLLGMYSPVLQFDGGRGIGNNQNVTGIYVPSPGYYGARLLWYNGGGGAGVEYYTTQTPLSGNTNYPVVINYTFDPAAILAFQESSAAPPYVSFAEPPLQDDQVSSGMNLHYQLTDASATVIPGSVLVTLNGASQASNTGVNKTGGVTDIMVTNNAGLPAGSNWVQLAFSDSAGSNYNYGYTFTVGGTTAVPLDTSLRTDVGTQDTTQPGFMLHVVQVDPCLPYYLGGPDDCGDGTENSIDSANGMLEGLYFPYYGTNAADTSTAVASNMWYWTGPVKFNITGYTSIDGFSNLPPLNGIPTIDGVASRPNDSLSASFDGYAVFPSAGNYKMVVASDDGFRLTESIGLPTPVLHVEGASVSMDIAVVPSTRETVGGNWLGELPTVPLTAPIVYVDTNGCPCLGTAQDLSGKIALIDGNRCAGDAQDGNYNNLVAMCQKQGALACIVQASPGWGTPERMTGGGQTINIPALHIMGFNGLKDWFHTNGPLTATIASDTTPRLGEADYGKGTSDINFTVNVPQAGVYPLHLTYEQGGGGAAMVWYTIQPNGTKVLVNDASTPGSVMVYRARSTAARPSITIARQGPNIVITYTGILRSAAVVTGPYAAVPGASSPYTVPISSAQAQFYRASQN